MPIRKRSMRRSRIVMLCCKLLRGTLLEEAKNGEARVLLRFFERNRGNGYSVPPRISFGYSRQRPAVADQTSPQKPFIAFSGIRAKPLMPEKVMRDSREKFKRISFQKNCSQQSATLALYWIMCCCGDFYWCFTEESLLDNCFLSISLSRTF